MNLEVGMYVRTDKGIISKIKNINTKCFINDKETIYIENMTKKIFGFMLRIEDIIKTSYNIIDLIEAGDYVNGYEVIQIDNGRLYFDVGDFTPNGIENKEIKSIVTKEQFKKMEYRMEENNVC